MIVLHGLVRDTQWKGASPSEHFPKHRADIWQLVSVIEPGQPIVTNYGVNLLLRLPEYLRIYSHSKEEIVDNGYSL